MEFGPFAPPALLVKPSLPIALSDILEDAISPYALLDYPFVKLDIDCKRSFGEDPATLPSSI